MTKNIGQAMREARLRRGLSQSKLSSLTGIHCVTLANYERGKFNPGPKNLAKLRLVLVGDLEAFTDELRRDDRGG